MTLSLLILSLATSTRSKVDASAVIPEKPVVRATIARPAVLNPTLKPSKLSVQGSSTPVAIGNSPILLNGQTYRLPWIQWQTSQGTRLGIADGAFRQLTGARFLSTDRVEVQPIDWFGSATLAAPQLPTQFLAGDRYLDITDWASAMGWQTQIQANQLSLTTPSAQVSQITQSSTPEFDRVVLTLDRPATYQVDAQSKEWVLSLDAGILPERLKSFTPQPSRRIAALKVEPDPSKSKTILRLGIPITSRPVLTTQSNPAQITIDIGIPDRRDQSILWQPGMQWRQQVMTIGNRFLTVLWFELDPRVVRLRPILPNAMSDPSGTAPLYQTAQQSQSLLAINGGFFNRINQLPLGMIQTNGVLRSGPILNRGVMAWDDTGNFRFDRYAIQETATIAQQVIPLTTINSAYVQAGVARYTSAWGTRYKTLSDNEVVMTVISDPTGDRIDSQKLAPVAGEEVSIPSSGYLLAIRSNRTLAATISTGSTVQIRTNETPNGISAFPQVLGGGPLLIQNRQIVLDATGEKFSAAFAQERAARSAIGRTLNGQILMVTVHNSVGSPGATLGDLAQIMQQLGATDALNFDGGSSTTLYLGGAGGQVLDRPSRSSARVHNAIGVFLK